ncbi:amidase, partial [Corynebacterium pseudodiphtheriticum]
KSLKELIRFNDAREGTQDDHQPVLKEIDASTLTPEQSQAAWDELLRDFRGTVDEPIKEHNLDAIVSDFDSNSYFGVAAAGYPGITVPSGATEDGLPGSAYFFGPAGSEAQLLAVAYGYEQGSEAAIKPKLSTPHALANS